MQITQADIDWTVDFWKEIWISQGKQYIKGRLLNPKSGTSVSIEEFIDGFVMLSGLGSDWKSEMSKFKDAILDKLEDQKKGVALKEFLNSLNKIDWANVKLVDTQENVHKYIVSSEHQVVTDSMGSYFVWDKATGACLNMGCEMLEMVVSS